ncbi:MAG: glycosyltransferase family 2 protein [bacterium]
MTKKPSIAVLIPCYNEEKTIFKVVQDFQKYLPESKVYVFDNNSTDQSVTLAQKAGAIVKNCYTQGKGNVVRMMFKQIEADIYILVDADDTYPAQDAMKMIQPIIENKADIVCGDRLSNDTYKNENKRSFHNFGNNLVRNLINFLFNSDLEDIMTGYRVFSKEFVKNSPILSKGFEVETEITLSALDKGFILKEIPILYRDRPAGSFSKLNTFSDGFKVLSTILNIFKDYKPLFFYSILTVMTFFVASIIMIWPLLEYIEFRFVYKLPSLVMAIGLYLVSILLLCVGLILDSVKKYHTLEYQHNLLKYKP